MLKVRVSCFLALSALAVAVAVPSHAQDNAGRANPPKGVAANGVNRIDSATLAARTQGRGRPTTGPGAASPGALIFVDSTGKTMGRAVGEEMVLAAWEGQQLKITGMDGFRRACATPGACLGPGDGATWLRDYGWLGYLEANCTGDPFAPVLTTGVFVANPVFDGGVYYLYIYRPAQLGEWIIHSSYVGGVCQNHVGGSSMTGAPVIAVVPASTYGTPPFFLK